MGPNDGMQAKLSMIEEKLDMIMDHLGVNQPDQPDEGEMPEMPPRKKMMDDLTSPEEE